MARLTLAGALVVVVLASGCTSSTSDRSAERPPTTQATTTTSPPPATEERIESRTVPLPESVTGARFPWWSADGSRLLFSAAEPGGGRVEIQSVAPDGSDLTCLTCGVAPEVDQPLLKPIPFRDGTRVIVRVGNQSPLQAADHAILECRPSVLECDDAELVPFAPPSGGDAAVTQDQRELRPAPDNAHIGFSQVRTSARGDATLVAVVGQLERTADTYEVRDARVVSERGELKSFTPDGRGALVAIFSPGPYETANPDVVRIDLATGEEERITSAPDYDEPVEMAPDGRSYVVGSGRGSGLFETVAQVRRPSLLGTALDPLTAYLFANHRAELLEGWVVPIGAEARGELGRRIAEPDRDYDGRAIYNWRPDGTAITYWEGKGNGFDPTPTDTRLVVVELLDREPSTAEGDVRTPTPRWAPELSGLVPAAIAPPSSRDGRLSGSVTVAATAAADGETVEVTYRGFSDEQGWVIDGVERAERRGNRTTYVADLALTGSHDGYLRADAVISAGAIEGTISSSVDGRALTLPRTEEGG